VNGDGKLAFSVEELSAATGLCRDSIYEEIRAERLRAKKFGRRTLILAADAQAFLAALPDVALPPKE
jgi:excisionase family DNA binding protein